MAGPGQRILQARRHHVLALDPAGERHPAGAGQGRPNLPQVRRAVPAPDGRHARQCRLEPRPWSANDAPAGVETPQRAGCIDPTRLLPAGLPDSKSLEGVTLRRGFDANDGQRHNAIVDIWPRRSTSSAASCAIPALIRPPSWLGACWSSKAAAGAVPTLASGCSSLPARHHLLCLSLNLSRWLGHPASPASGASPFSPALLPRQDLLWKALPSGK